MQTSHLDKVAGWSIIGLFVLGVVAIIVGAYAPHLSPSGQTALFVIGSNAGAAVAGSLWTRRNSAPPADPPTT